MENKYLRELMVSKEIQVKLIFAVLCMWNVFSNDANKSFVVM